MEIYENRQETERAVLVSADTGEFDAQSSLNELEELARTAGAQVIASLVQKREALDKATAIGSGRLAELGEVCVAQEADLVIFDGELSPTQLRNLEEILPCRIIDRTMLILDIFASRARSAEGRLQVELAQLEYRLPRLAGQGVALSRLGGGIGTRGPGETKLESDRRHIRRRIGAIKQQLEQVQRRRESRRTQAYLRCIRGHPLMQAYAAGRLTYSPFSSSSTARSTPAFPDS